MIIWKEKKSDNVFQIYFVLFFLKSEKACVIFHAAIYL